MDEDNPFELPEEVSARVLKLNIAELLANSPMAPVQFASMAFRPLTQSWAIGLDLDHSEQHYRPPDELLSQRVLAVFISGNESQIKMLLALRTLGKPVDYIHHVAPQAPSSMVVPVKVMAECFNLSTRRIQQLADEGVMVKVGRGSYNLIESLRRYVDQLRKEAEGTGGAQKSKYEIKLAEEKALKAETDRLYRDKKLGDIQAFEDRAFTLGRAIQSALDALPRLAPELAVMGDARAIRERLDKEKRGILDGLKDQCTEVAG